MTTILAAGLDSSGYVRGAREIQRANLDLEKSVLRARDVLASIDTSSRRFGSGASTGFSAARNALEQLARPSEHFKHMLAQIYDRIIRIGATLVVFRAIQAVFGGLIALMREAINYSSLMETAGLGIASSFMIVHDFVDKTTGKIVGMGQAFGVAQKMSKDAIDQLRVANLQTIATLDQLVQGYQIALPVAIRKGFDKDQVIKFTTSIYQMAGAIGQPFDQMSEEIRSLLGAAPVTRHSRMAQVLGLTSKDIAQFKNDGQALFKFLEDKMKPFTIAGVESQKTWLGVISNLKDIGKILLEGAFAKTFDFIRHQLIAVQNEFLTIDNINNKAVWNKVWLDRMKKVGDIVREVAGHTVSFIRFMTTEFKLFGVSLGVPIAQLARLTAGLVFLRTVHVGVKLLAMAWVGVKSAINAVVDAYSGVSKAADTQQALAAAKALAAQEAANVTMAAERAYAAEREHTARIKTLFLAKNEAAANASRIGQEQWFAQMRVRAAEQDAFRINHARAMSAEKQKELGISIQNMKMTNAQLKAELDVYRAKWESLHVQLQENEAKKQALALQIKRAQAEMAQLTSAKGALVTQVSKELSMEQRKLTTTQNKLALMTKEQLMTKQGQTLLAKEQTQLQNINTLMARKNVLESEYVALKQAVSTQLGLETMQQAQNALEAESVVLRKSLHAATENLTGAEIKHTAAKKAVKMAELAYNEEKARGITLSRATIQTDAALAQARLGLATSTKEVALAKRAMIGANTAYLASLKATQAAADRYNAGLIATGSAEKAVTVTQLARRQAIWATLTETQKAAAVNVLHARYLDSLAVSTVKLTLAQRASAVAAGIQRMAISGLNAVLALTGGWIGLITVALFAGAWAWTKYGNEMGKARKNAKQAAEDIGAAANEVSRELQAMKDREEYDKKKAKGDKIDDKDPNKFRTAMGSRLAAYDKANEDLKKINEDIAKVEATLARYPGSLSKGYYTKHRQTLIENRLNIIMDRNRLVKESMEMFNKNEAIEAKAKEQADKGGNVGVAKSATSDEKELLNSYLSYKSFYYKSLIDLEKNEMSNRIALIDESYRKMEISQEEHINRTYALKNAALLNEKSYNEQMASISKSAYDDWKAKHPVLNKVIDEEGGVIRPDKAGLMTPPRKIGDDSDSFKVAMNAYKTQQAAIKEGLVLLQKMKQDEATVKTTSIELDGLALQKTSELNKAREDLLNTNQSMAIEYQKIMGNEIAAHELYAKSAEYKRRVIDMDSALLNASLAKVEAARALGAEEQKAAQDELAGVQERIKANQLLLEVKGAAALVSQRAAAYELQQAERDRQLAALEGGASRGEITSSDLIKEKIRLLTEQHLSLVNIQAVQADTTAEEKRQYASRAKDIEDVTQKILEQKQALDLLKNETLIGVVQGFRDYTKSIEDSGVRLRDVTLNALKGMEDAFVEFVTTGKLSFKSLVDSIIADLARMVVQQTVTKPLSNMMGGLLGGLLGSGGGGIFSLTKGGGGITSGAGTAVSNFGGLMTIGGRAVGDSYVAFDAPYFLHQGEGVLTREENADRMAGRTGNSVSVSVPISIENGNNALVAELRQEMEQTALKVIRRHS